MNLSQLDELFEQILRARQRVYEVGQPTPLQVLEIKDFDALIYAKREDLGPIKAYKWRGAYNCMASLSEEQRERGVVAASAGNHAQGVALAARMLGCDAHIFMPRSTPEVKQDAVKKHGDNRVFIYLVGDSYDAASVAAKDFAKERNLSYIHPYDDFHTIAGQGTLADEVVMSGQGPFDHIYLQIGGGGLAAGAACWFRKFWPEVRLVGVEGEKQASMKLAIEQGERAILEHVDVFCDGTAVRQAGEITYPLCKELFDEFCTVSNDEVCAAMRAVWDGLRLVPEPSGAMGLAALLQDWDAGKILPGDKCLVIITGANMDFSRLRAVASRAGERDRERSLRYLRIPMQTKRGEVLKYLKQIPSGVQLREVQYGRIGGDIQYPVFGVYGTEKDFALIAQRLAEKGLEAEDVTEDIDVRIRMISYDRARLQHPVFFVIEFPERPGAFYEFMSVMGQHGSLCYFNYQYTGEHVGRALVGFEFDSREDRETCRQMAEQLKGTTIQGLHELSDRVRRRVLGIMSPEEEEVKAEPRIILASQSPRRRDLLQREGVKFEIHVEEVEELHDASLSPEELCAHNAAIKAEIIAQRFPNDIVIGADTLVFIDNEPLGKPADEEDALRMLERLQGRSHCVCTAVALFMPDGERRDFVEKSYVRFLPRTREQLIDYIKTVYVLDKAGSYAMQEHSEMIVESVEGDVDNVIGLPVKRLLQVIDL